MNATCSDINEPVMGASPAGAQSRSLDRKLDPANNFLYQAATVLAILLFLVSF